MSTQSPQTSASRLPLMMSRAAMDCCLIRNAGTFIERLEQSRYRGFVESIDSNRGLVGWLADSESCQPATVVLCLDEIHLLQVEVSSPRPDIWQGGGSDHPTGFVFEIDDLLKIGARTDISPEAKLRIGVAGVVGWLSSFTELTFADLQVLRAPKSNDTYLVGEWGDVGLELTRLARKANRFLSNPVRVDPSRQVGVVEYTVRLSRHRWLLGGWMRDYLPSLCATILVLKGAKIPASFAAITGHRADLPADARAFVAILHIDDEIALKDFTEQLRIIFVGKDMEWLGPISTIRRPELTQAIEEADLLLLNSDGTRGRELRLIVREASPWNSAAQRSDESGAKLGIDRFIIVPGFGALVSGWILHPISRPKNLKMKLGGSMLTVDDTTLTLFPRPDIASVFPSMADRVGTAGFSCVLRGDGLLDYSDKWQLRVEFEDDSVYLGSLSAEAARTIDAESHPGEISTVIPGFEWTSWATDLTKCVASNSKRQALKNIRWLNKVLMPKAIIFILPTIVPHQGVVLDAIARIARKLSGSDIGIILMLPASLSPGVWAAWTAVMEKKNVATKIASARLGAASDSWSLISTILNECRVDRFAFAGPSVMPAQHFLADVTAYFNSTEGRLEYLPVQVVQGGATKIITDAMAFCWTASKFEQHSHISPSFWPGYWRMNGLPAVGAIKLGSIPSCLRFAPMGSDSLKDRLYKKMMSVSSINGIAQ